MGNYRSYLKSNAALSMARFGGAILRGEYFLACANVAVGDAPESGKLEDEFVKELVHA